MPAPLQDGTGLLGVPKTTLFAWLVSFTCDKFGHPGAGINLGDGKLFGAKSYKFGRRYPARASILGRWESGEFIVFVRDGTVSTRSSIRVETLSIFFQSILVRSLAYICFGRYAQVQYRPLNIVFFVA